MIASSQSIGYSNIDGHVLHLTIDRLKDDIMTGERQEKETYSETGLTRLVWCTCICGWLMLTAIWRTCHNQVGDCRGAYLGLCCWAPNTHAESRKTKNNFNRSRSRSGKQSLVVITSRPHRHWIRRPRKAISQTWASSNQHLPWGSERCNVPRFWILEKPNVTYCLL